MRRSCGLVFAIVWFVMTICVLSSSANSLTWDCPECGRRSNTGNYCGNCAHAAPWIGKPQFEYVVGDTVFFGHYEQDNNLANGKEEIEWIILAVEENKALLISKYGLDAQPYNTTYADVRWDNCTLRGWLNETFYAEAFSQTEQARIIQVKTDNSASQDLTNHSSKGSKNTLDVVFLLSNKEAIQDYVDVLSLNPCSSTEYAKAQGAYTFNGFFGWKLRTPWPKQNYGLLEIQQDNGKPYVVVNERSDATSGAIRPAIWVTVD